MEVCVRHEVREMPVVRHQLDSPGRGAFCFTAADGLSKDAVERRRDAAALGYISLRQCSEQYQGTLRYGT